MRLHALLLCLLPACGSFVTEGPGSSTGGGTGTAMDTAELAWKEQARTLETHRSQFLPTSADEHTAAGNRLYWLDTQTFIPKLRSADLGTQATVKYSFTIGVDSSAYVFKASQTLVATVSKSGQTLTYRAWAANAEGQALGEFSVAAPSDEQRWWPFCVEGDVVYYADSVGGGHLYRWGPGDAAPSQVLAFASAGIELGILLEFSVEAGQLVLLESGRLWSVDLASGRARFLKNKQEADEVSFDASGILFRTHDGLLFEDATAPGTLRNVTQELLAVTPFPVRPYSHRDDGERALLHQGTVLYIGWSGVFEYTLASKAVRALLLEPEGGDERIEYRQPELTTDGSLFVVGLTSTSGSVGADGPIYRLTQWQKP